eukprot:TRINITY_DN11886_c0_g1_i1.p1 TRINITY_DN11886_c0_g1~~TRINITY_DN11886_c0_g1_i1.p1  ORF type:complete len:648 (-),score=202.10 TRINITY_DN11886_c0_g1_i1:88-2031(-)
MDSDPGVPTASQDEECDDEELARLEALACQVFEEHGAAEGSAEAAASAAPAKVDLQAAGLPKAKAVVKRPRPPATAPPATVLAAEPRPKASRAALMSTPPWLAKAVVGAPSALLAAKLSRPMPVVSAGRGPMRPRPPSLPPPQSVNLKATVPRSMAPVGGQTFGASAASSSSGSGKGGKGKAKGSKGSGPGDGGIGQRVVALNKLGHWSQGRRIDVASLKALRACEDAHAQQILDELEEKGADVQNASQFIQKAIKAGPKAGTDSKQDEPRGTKRKEATAEHPEAPPWKQPAKGAGKSNKSAEDREELAKKRQVAKGEESLEWPKVKPTKAAHVAGSDNNAAESEAPAEDEGWQEEPEVAGEEPASLPVVQLPKSVTSKLKQLETLGVSLDEEALFELAETSVRNAELILEGLLIRQRKAPVAKPSKFVMVSLQRFRDQQAAKEASAGGDAADPASPQAPVGKAPVAKAPVTKASVAKAPVAKAPVAKAAVAKGPVAKAPVAKAPVAKAPVAKAPVAKTGGAPAAPKGHAATLGQRLAATHQKVAKAALEAAALPMEGAGEAPVQRQSLEFEERLVQEKLLSLNRLGIWEAPHALDEAALRGLLRISPGRAIEILEEVEDLAGNAAEPSKFILNQVAEEEIRLGREA